jgi:sensor histidine kinase YesM
MNANERVTSHTPHLKAGLEVFRDSLLLSAGLAVIVGLLIDHPTPRVMLFVASEIFIYTVLIMFLAHTILNQIWNQTRVCKSSDAVQWTVFIVGLIAICGLGSIVGSLIVAATGLESGMTLAALIGRSFRTSVIVSLMVGVNEVAFGRLRGQLEETQLKLRTEELERERALKLASEARLGSLESRLHPHFLFNALNSVSSLIPSDPARAERLVERIASLLRFSLDSNKGGLVALEQELKVVRDYLEIEQARLGQRLRYTVETIGDIQDLQLPPLSVQTLVENSVKFAIASTVDGGEIRVRADRNNGCLYVNVADTGDGFALESIPPDHGLDNLRSRLAVLFGERAQLNVAHEGPWTTVTMKVPV